MERSYHNDEPRQALSPPPPTSEPSITTGASNCPDIYTRQYALSVAWVEASDQFTAPARSGKARRTYTPEQRLAARNRTKRWNAEHPGYHNAYWAGVRAERVGAAGHWTAADMAARWAMWGDQCWMCGAAATCNDHVKPLSKGGSNWPANLRPACEPCNRRKWNSWPFALKAAS